MFLLAALALQIAPVSHTVPNKQPQLAVGNGVVAMVFGSGEEIWLAESADQGRSFGAPAKIATLPKLLLGRHRGPRVTFAGKALIVSAISSEAGDLMAWRSTDGGHNWSAPMAVNDRPKAAREGLHAMAADAEGHVAAVWLDDRVGPRGKRLWGAFSEDAGATWSKNVMLYESPSGTICECCHPSLAAVGHGEFAAMWRNAVDGYRDLYTMRLRGGASAGPAQKQGTGTWKLEACPMDGGGLVERDGRISSAWRREKDVYLAESGKPEVRLGAGQDIALAANAKGLYAVWSTPQGIVVKEPGAAEAKKLSDTGGFPALAVMPDGAILVAWEENGAIATTRLGSNYPAAWWRPVPEQGKPDWEILPQEAKPGEVILSKRNELGILSNFAATPFTYRGKRYASVEGFWQMMLYPEGAARDGVAALTGFDAKDAGARAEENMRKLGIAWVTFEGKRMPYRSAEKGAHYRLIVEAMRAKLEQNPRVREVLLSTGDLVLRPDHVQEPNAPPEWRYFEIWMDLRRP